MKKQAKITIKDVAEEAGVAIATVDRVLHNRGRVSEETRRKIIEIVDRLGYKPNIVAQTLASKKSYQIAVVYHNTEISFWGEVEKGIRKAEEEFVKVGFSIDRFVLQNINIEEQVCILEHVLGASYDGLVIMPYKSDRIKELLRRIKDKGIEIILINNKEFYNDYYYVGQDVYRSGRVAAQLMTMLVDKGGTIAILSAAADIRAPHDRIEGFVSYVKEKNMSYNLLGPFDFNQNKEYVYDLTKEIVKADNVDGIYVTNIYVSFVANALRDMGLGDRIKLVGFDYSDDIERHIVDGTIDATVCQEPIVQGYMPFRIIYDKLILGMKHEELDYLTKLDIFIKENI